jgi:hypothetical protein
VGDLCAEGFIAATLKSVGALTIDHNSASTTEGVRLRTNWPSGMGFTAANFHVLLDATPEVPDENDLVDAFHFAQFLSQYINSKNPMVALSIS